MSTTAPREMTGLERDEFLGTGGSGVISFAPTDATAPPHAVPVSYGYDGTERVFYFRLAVGKTRAKPDPTAHPVSFVTYGHEDDGWRSVVATGTLDRTTEDDVALEALTGLERVHIPLVDIFGVDSGDVQFEFYRLVPTELTTRREESTAP